MNLQDIKQKTGPNPGGSVRLWLLPWQYLNAIPDPDPVSGIISDPIDFDMSVQWHEFEFMPGRCRLQNPTAGQESSHWFDTVIDVSVSGDDQERMSIFENMLNGLFIALVDQASGNIKLCGSKYAPLACRLSYDGGDDIDNFAGTIFQFRSKGWLPRTYTGDIRTYKVAWRVKESSAFCVKL